MAEPSHLVPLAERTLRLAREKDLTLVAAESCTAAKLSALLSEAPGATEHLHGGFVTYTKANKIKSLGVSSELLQQKGAVCRAVAVAMVKGALARSPADLAVAITGVAGPAPDEDGNPVGLVCFAVARKDRNPWHEEMRCRSIGREDVQAKAMAEALPALIRLLETQ
ncbi:MAG TPA: CinA family protein [Terriglobales bacterium]|nr:CinA family protein [Terriglobales bacterium]